MHISILVAVAENGVIGRAGRLPWRLAGDLQRFKRLTMGHTIVMGRKTWESIARPLPGRHMVVVSRQPNYCVDVTGVEMAGSLAAALEKAKASGDDEAFVVGGAELYRLALAIADRLYLTRVQACVDGDTHFPDFDQSEWRLVESFRRDASEKDEYPYRCEVFHRDRANR